MTDSANETSQPRLWPLWLFVVACLLADFVLPPMIDWLDFGSFDREIMALVFLVGVLVVQGCFVAVVAGLSRRTWMGGYLSALFLAAIGYVAVFAGFRLIGEFNTEMFSGIALLPVFLLSAASPLFLLRHWFGWRLVASDDAALVRQPHSLADIFSQVALVAAALVMARVPQVVMENDVDGHWVPVAITGLTMFGISLVVLPIHVRIALGAYRPATKVASLVVLPLVIVGLCFGVIQCFSPATQSWNQRLQLVPFELAFLGSAIAVFYCSLWALVASGVSLVHVNKLAQPSNVGGANVASRKLAQLTWWRIGGAIAVTTITSIGLANLERWRAVRDAENLQLNQLAQAVDGYVDIEGRIPNGLVLGANATDDFLRKFRACSRIQYLKPDRSKISDQGLAELRYYPQLRSVILEGVDVSDEGLEHLRYLTKLNSLEITDCEVTGS